MTTKLVRTPSLKRGKGDIPVANRVKLERVIGLTVVSNSALCCDPNTENILYTAGCTVVSFSPHKNKQTHVLNTSRKAVTCIAVTSDGNHLATGECGHMPSVRVWDILSGTQLTELSGHQYGINCVAFSPNGKHLVSIGSQHDMIVNVWEWKTNLKVASNKVSTKVKAVSFAEDGKYFVTVGMRHVKFWYLEYSRSGKFLDAVPLMGRAGIMGELRDKDFCDVACGRGMMIKSTFTITKSGQLCEVNSRRMLEKWVELRTSSANCMSLGWNYIFVGCADGIVRCFNPMTLQFVTTLPRTHYLGFDISQGFDISHMVQHPNNAKYPDTIAVTFDDSNMKLTCIYNDHSIYIWDVHDIKRVGKTYSFLFHSGCIWGVDTYPLLDSSLPSAMPNGSFITCSSDDTIRVWNLESSLPANTHFQKNIYSEELLKIVYVDSSLSFIKNQDLSDNLEKNDAATYDSRNGVRSLCISPDGQHLATGDRMGNIRIHNLNNMQELCFIEAHDAEVLTLQYSRPECGHRLLASASRDRLLHIFNVEKDYSFAEAFDGHSSSITAVKFITAKDHLQVVSCGADKSIIFRHLVPMLDDTIHFARGHIVACKTTLYDMEVDSSQKNILTACQDRNVRVYNINTGRQKKTFRGSVSEDGSLIKLALDNSGIYLATSCTDKTLCVYDYYSGECMATMLGHSELVTGLKFTNDCSRLISASGDGCIFVWQIPHDMVVTMQARLSQQAARLEKKLQDQSNENLVENLSDVPISPHNVLDILSGTSQNLLPTWASRHESHSLSVANLKQQHNLPGGRWAQRLAAMQEQRYDALPIMLKPFDLQEKRLDSDGSKESSLDSGTELRTYTDKEDLRKGLDLESTEHDGDVEDISEAECEPSQQEHSPRPLRVYYPPPIETGSDFTVNAMDVEELKRSMRRHKKPLFPEVSGPSVSTSVSGSQDSDDDDEEVSTPSGETTERSLHSASASMENIDFLVQREKFLKNTFESLSGAEVDNKQLLKPPGGNSITSQFLGQASLSHQEGKTRQLPPWKNYAPTRAPPSSPRNNVIGPKRVSSSHNELEDKRSLLKRRLEDMKQQLESVGYTRHGARINTAAKPLRNSVSVADLTELDNRKDSRSKVHQDFVSMAESDEEFGGMRRTYSLSDLRPSLWEGSGDTHQLDLPLTKSRRRDVPRKQVFPSRSGQEATDATSNKRAVVQAIGAANLGTVSRESSMNRSVSMGELNQSDCYGDAVQNRLNSLMRPTISSRNKVVSVSKNSAGPPSIRHYGLTSSHSSVNLSRLENEESSSEEVLGPGRSRLHVHNLDRSASANNINTAAFRPPSGFKSTANVVPLQVRPSSSRLVSSGAHPKQFARPRQVSEHKKSHHNLTVCLDLAKKLKDSAQQVNDALSQLRNQSSATDSSQKVDVLLEALQSSMLMMMAGEFFGLEVAGNQEWDVDRWIQYLREQLAVVVRAYLSRTASKQGTDDEWQEHLERVIEDVTKKLLDVLIDESKPFC
ncbi:mitogen-activated protein kinase-binding protein 1 isoform X2 [Bacillus rossius redtenbacheri]|uniref:mitogen-activated protein kinase-binding protein 1 isoform X2 n=1 Tax=Bacillus rossius redtenbacheri TaxID=93214 RepID=UPI002FDD51B8